MSKELTEQWRNGTLEDGWYFLEFENGSILPVYYCGFNREFEFRWDWKISKVLAPASYDQFVELTEKVERFEKQLEYAERTLKNIRVLMTCDPSDMKEIDENFCANQLALETVNGYFEKYGVEK